MPDNVLPTSGPGRPKDPAKRKAILEAAKCLFLRHGYAGSSMDAIAAHAGVSKLTVYSHFTDKETLFCAAVKAKCEEQLPELLFELPDGVAVEGTLLNIAHGFNRLINSAESIELHRLMISLGAQDPLLSRVFYEAGPQRLLCEMERLLSKAEQRGQLRLESAKVAADQFFSLLKGCANFRLMIGCGEPQGETEQEQHAQHVVRMFLRAYRP
ncbi:TetR/AcrR family transcriptional regulator [Phytopseudomonas dryadis]|uniref:TetR family transcriptional regulator n=1 Tax=Phytopseudomonas dryadis TaxID=2487520 RepID=A0ABY1Z7R4_9GAMM|nr:MULTISPECIES: TetR/AcrR family transcriptional regulator [Pseudomonas]TBV07249.1 TetR family transcriptional regulator [Pseudomonas dryadis]TBV13428.1 TetR family transcriptional regulator [Pseudomonas sp. FRB 230]